MAVKNSMKVSILVANYNNGKFFNDCYISIVEQTYDNWEVIIVDDGSTDNSVEIIRRIIKDHKNFKLFENDKNYGCGYTKRRCVELATGDVCGFLDPDDALVPIALEKMVLAYINQDYVLVYSRHHKCDTNLNKTGTSKNGQILKEDIFNLNYDITAFTTFLRKAYLQTEGINAYCKRAVDQDLYIKLLEIGKAKFINELLYLYRIHSMGIASNLNPEKAYFWHWFAIMKAAERRQLNIENLFTETFILRKRFLALEKAVNESEFKKISEFLYPILKLFKVKKPNRNKLKFR